MNNRGTVEQEKGKNASIFQFFSKFGGKPRDILIICVLALILLIVGWKIFHSGKSSSASGTDSYSQNEWKAMRILQEIDGVGEASVVVSETADGVQSVVVMCEGAHNISVVMDIREAISAALNTPQKSVKIYLKKE